MLNKYAFNIKNCIDLEAMSHCTNLWYPYVSFKLFLFYEKNRHKVYWEIIENSSSWFNSLLKIKNNSRFPYNQMNSTTRDEYSITFIDCNLS